MLNWLDKELGVNKESREERPFALFVVAVSAIMLLVVALYTINLQKNKDTRTSSPQENIDPRIGVPLVSGPVEPMTQEQLGILLRSASSSYKYKIEEFKL